jgi:hypothetical protein
MINNLTLKKGGGNRTLKRSQIRLFKEFVTYFQQTITNKLKQEI